MGTKGPEKSADERLIAIATAQHGVVSTSQLLAAGVSWAQIRGRCSRGWLRRIHTGVYIVGPARPTQRGIWLAAVLAQPGSVLSHGSAAAAWQVRPRETGDVHVAVPDSIHRRARAGIAMHRTDVLPGCHVTFLDQIPLTTVPRTLVDIAAVVTERQAERALDEAARLRLCDEAAIEAILAAHPRLPGASMMAAVRASHRIGSTLTRSELEERFLALCREYRLPDPEVNARVGPYTVDFLWREEKLIVETDGWQSHGTRRAYEDDRERDFRLGTCGYHVTRVSYRQVVREPRVVAHGIRTLLRARALAPAP